MDNLRNFYETCEITVDIECEDLPEEIEKALLASNFPPMEIEQPQPPVRPPPPPRQNPKPPRQLRLTLKSPELRKRFTRVVDSVPGRAKEAEHIFGFITKAQNGSSSPLCLHGNTGCGKTSLVTKVLQFFEQNSGTVTTAYLNCMSIRTVNLIYVYLLERFYGGRKQARGGKAADTLQRCLMDGMGRNEPTKIVVLDEIDHVIGQHNFLYNMFQWLVTGAKIVLVLISNVIDLAVRLDSKLQSRIKFQTLIFQPYRSAQIEAIILHKYPNIHNICRQESIRFIAIRIYNINSDIRTLDKIFNRIHAAWVHRGKILDFETVRKLMQDEISVTPMQSSYALVANILHMAERGIDVTNTILQRLYIQCQYPHRKEDVFLLLCDLQDAGLITLMTKPKSPDATFFEYGIKVHESLRLYIESCGK